MCYTAKTCSFTNSFLKMSKEHETEEPTGVPQDLEQLETWVQRKEPSLPGSIRDYIAKLKAKGEWSEAMRVRKEAEVRKAQSRYAMAREELHRTIRTIFETEDKNVEGVQTIRAVWLLSAVGELNAKVRPTEIIDSLKAHDPETQKFVSEKLVELRDEIQKRYI